MAGRNRGRVLIMGIVAALLCVPAASNADQIARRRGIDTNRGWETTNSDVYDRGYREGLSRGQRDAERGRAFDMTRDAGYRNGDRGYHQRYGNRETYRDTYRTGFEAGYRRGYDQVRTVPARQTRRNQRVIAPRATRTYQEPASARGYSDGYEKGLDDGHDRDRYDPVRHSDYRQADQGYYGDYGSKDAYKNNYRAGFRQGYEDGYRVATRNVR